jgi:hypothetical protein
MENQQQIQIISDKIDKIKVDLQTIGPMRPGSINEQFKDPKEKKGSYHQLNYTHKMKTHTDYIRKANLEMTREEVSEYQRFKELTEHWITLSIELSKLKLKVRHSKI